MITVPKNKYYTFRFGTILLLMALNSCTHKIENTVTSAHAVCWAKMDASLRSEVRGGLEANSDTSFVVFAELTDDDNAYVSDFVTIDVEVQSRAGVIWTLKGNAQSLTKASCKEFVKRMELSQKRRTS